MILCTLPPAYLSWTLAAVVSFAAFFAIVAAVMIRRPRMTDEEIVLHKIAKNLGMQPDCIDQDPPKEYSRAREEQAEHRQRLETERRKMEEFRERRFEQSSSLLDSPGAE